MPRATYLASLATRNDIIVDIQTLWLPTGIPLSYPVVKTITFVNSDILFDDDRREGLGLQAEIMENGLTVTGHSLGGHLATAFTRLFPETGAEALTINGAGFALTGFSGFGTANANNLFSMLQGASSFDDSRIHNLYGDKNSNIVTQDGPWLYQQGNHDAIFIEQEGFWQDTIGHGSGQMTDALAIYDVFFRLTGNASLSNLQAVFESASNRRDPTFEYLVNALGDLFGAGTRITTLGDREQLHVRLEAIRNHPIFINIAGQLTLTPATGDNARSDFGQFLALYFGTSFAFSGSEAFLAQINSAAYVLWQEDQSLTPEQRTNGEAHFSDQTNMNQINAPRIVFGDNSNNTSADGPDGFIGGEGNDRLYGMGGLFNKRCDVRLNIELC